MRIPTAISLLTASALLTTAAVAQSQTTSATPGTTTATTTTEDPSTTTGTTTGTLGDRSTTGTTTTDSSTGTTTTGSDTGMNSAEADQATTATSTTDTSATTGTTTTGTATTGTATTGTDTTTGTVSGAAGTTGTSGGTGGYGTSGTATTGATTGSMASDTGTASAGSSALGGTDATFLSKAMQAGQEEVQNAQLAMQSAKRAETRNAASMMLEDHQRANSQLEQLAQRKGWSMPAASASAQGDQATQASAVGDFDAHYVTEEIRHHREAISLYRAEASGGSDPDLRQFAKDGLPKLEHHLDMLENANTRK